MGDFWPPESDHTGQYALLVAMLLAISHLAGPWIRKGLRSQSTRVVSFGGGLAVAYVFLKLVPEIEEAHEYLGDNVHIIILFSFLAFYALESHFLNQRGQFESEGQEGAGSRRSFWLHVTLGWFYTWMIIFALPRDATDELFLAVFVSLSIGLHIVFKSYMMHVHHRAEFETRGRYVLATAPLIGWISHVMIQPSEAVFDVSIAILAGFLMQGVFREELPSYNQTRFRWLLLGAVIFLVIVLIGP